MQVPLATGECLYARFEFLNLIAARAADIIQPDVCVCGGLLEMRKIAAIAEAHYVTIAPHNPMGPIATAVNVHFAAATHNFKILEYVIPCRLQMDGIRPGSVPACGRIPRTQRPSWIGHRGERRRAGGLRPTPLAAHGARPSRWVHWVHLEAAIGGQVKAKSKNPLPLKFPAYGVFLLKRPKGTKSRRWAPGPALCMARIPSPDSRHTPACRPRMTTYLGGGTEERALLWRCSLFEIR